MGEARTPPKPSGKRSKCNSRQICLFRRSLFCLQCNIYFTQGADFKWCLVPDQGLPRPDIVFQLDADIDEIKHREGFGDERYETENFQKNVRDNFKKFENYHYWRVIDAFQDRDVVHREITDHILSLVNEYNKPGDDIKKNYYPNSIGLDLFTKENI